MNFPHIAAIMNAERRKHFVVAIAVTVLAAMLRIWPLQALESGLAWLTFYPATMVAAIYGGFYAGVLASALACAIVVFGWPLLVAQPFIRAPADWLGLSVFFMTGLMISTLAEAMRRAESRAMLARQHAEEANQAKSKFLASMSHELRTPLNAILGFSEILCQDPTLSDQHRKTLAIVNKSGEHLLTLINDVLDMAKVDAGRLNVELSACDLQSLLGEVTELMRARAAQKQLRLVIETAPNAAPNAALRVYADAVKLRQVMLNLVGNAIKFTNAGDVVIRLSSRPAESPQQCRILLEVEDSGMGIHPDDVGKIFEPFVQGKAESAGQLKQGTGLGLAISRQFVELMGGNISVHSTLGQGSTFSIELLLDRVAQTDTSAPSESDPAPTAAQAPAQEKQRVRHLAAGQPPCRVLVVEDQEENWLLLQHLLEPVGFEVQLAKNGQEGIDAFIRWQPHIILTDIRMPVMDGMEATRRIRLLTDGDKVKIVAISASVFEHERAHFMVAGMDEFIRKPLRSDELFACIAHHLGVQFVYETGQALAAEPAPLGPQDLAALPDALRSELTEALLTLDASQITATIARITEVHPVLGATLAHHAEQFSYSLIRKALQESV